MRNEEASNPGWVSSPSHAGVDDAMARSRSVTSSGVVAIAAKPTRANRPYKTTTAGIACQMRHSMADV